MISKILIANRGEIACRVIRSARAMGISTVAVYSDADKDAVHVRQADEAIYIGAAPAAESYLVMDRILDAVRRSGADAVHPGYGFLSENSAFAEALAKEGVAFIGPGTRAIGAMGDKIESKKLAAEAKVNTVPGYLGVIADEDEAVKIAGDIGYPVMIKASAGGGGKGMRVAWNDVEAREGFTSAVSEAKSSFGDDRVFVEKFIEQPRHIEIQVLGDSHGNLIYLGERECSIQRRHQKVIEEAPSPFLDEETRRAMGEQAVALAKAVDYQSAGTVEFIVDANRNFYFLEMNTRLQVEHPVTEMITGVDLVEQMIRVASGEKLSITQDDVKLNGWAMESRVYAEDPRRGFLPSIGRLRSYRPPAEDGTHVRIDTGVTEGSEITMYYDPMIAKLCTWGATRDKAIEGMSAALNGFYIRGIAHNIGFVSAVMAHPRFIAGNLTTGFIEEEFPEGFQGATLSDETRNAMIAVATLVRWREMLREGLVSGQMDESPAMLPEEWVMALDGENYPVQVSDVEGGVDVTLDGHLMAVRSDWTPGMLVFEGTVNVAHFSVEVDRQNEGHRLSHGGAEIDLVLRRPEEAEYATYMPVKVAPDMSKYLLCPMPGQIIAVEVSEGEEVKAGQALAVVEAMKMENILRAESDGTVETIHVEVGSNLAVDEIIIEFADD